MKKKRQEFFRGTVIKKIMQLDESVGKMTSLAPEVIAKALELFILDLCDRAYQITLRRVATCKIPKDLQRREAKIMIPQDLKKCIQTYSVFDFLEHIVSNVPDEIVPAARKKGQSRKAAVKEDNDGNESNKRSRLDSSSSRGRGKGGKSNSGSTKSADPGKLKDNEVSSGAGRGRGGKSNSESLESADPGQQYLLAAELEARFMRDYDKIFKPDEDYDTEDEG